MEIPPKQCSYKLEREDSGVLAGAEHINEGLAHKEPDGDTDGDSNHRTPNVDAVPLRRDTAGLRQTGLRQNVSARTPDTTMMRKYVQGPGTAPQ